MKSMPSVLSFAMAVSLAACVTPALSQTPAPVRAAAPAATAPPAPKKKPLTVDCDKAKEVMECVLADAWGFFRSGDKNRDGFIDYDEFMAHPVYKEVGYDLRTRTFIFWMVDDNKDSRISLQEWIHNEVSQFRMGDKNNDGLIDDREYEAILRVQAKLFKDANLGGM
jgi:hypothetical protein